MKTFIFSQTHGNEIRVDADTRLEAETILEDTLTEIEVNYQVVFGEGRWYCTQIEQC